jgi:hypothetical protein
MPKQTQPYERSSKLRLPEIIFNNFIGGISWGIGATVGVAVFFAILTLIAKNVNLVPVVGSFVSDVINFILATNPNLHK